MTGFAGLSTARADESFPEIIDMVDIREVKVVSYELRVASFQIECCMLEVVESSSQRDALRRYKIHRYEVIQRYRASVPRSDFDY